MPPAVAAVVRILGRTGRCFRPGRARSGEFIQSDALYRSLVEMCPETIFICRESRVIYVNPAGVRLFGAASSSQLLGKTPFDLFHPECHPVLRQRMGFLMQGDAAPLVRSRILRLDGKALDVEVVSSPFIDRGVFVLQSLMRDITERVQAEKVLQRDKETFERLVHERTASLIDVQVELEKAKRLSDIGTLATTVAHELRNPLAAIELAASNIERKSSDQQLAGHLATIHKKVAESDQIINNLLFYSRLKTPHFSPINICEVLLDSVNASSAHRAGKAISFDIRVDPVRKMMVNADYLQIKEVFLNILNNAADAIPSSVKGLIEVCGETGGNNVLISFCDNGVGMSAEVRRQAFEPFFTTKSKGTGLGLTVSAQIVKFHHGSIKVEPVDGRPGTRVLVSFPAHTGCCHTGEDENGRTGEG